MYFNFTACNNCGAAENNKIKGDKKMIDTLFNLGIYVLLFDILILVPCAICFKIFDLN